MATLVALTKDVLDSMSDEERKNNLEEIKTLAGKLVSEGYMVQKISCGECDLDDLLVQVHTCNPHRFTHNCTSKRKA
jgi:predicted metal-dependent enzyme (double-stranded beta helix superfamily)